jgi:hypothetical protein
MDTRRLATALAATLFVAPSAHAASCRLADLRWMIGVWRDDSPGVKSEERWVAGPGDRLMGSSWLLHDDRPGGVVEAETIQADKAGAINLTLRHFTADLASAWEEKTAPMVFTAADCGPKSVVFDGQGDHAGEHITYRRDGSVLNFTGDFLHGGKPIQVVIQFQRGGD